MSVVKKMSGTFALTAFVALTSIAALGCGEDEDPEGDGGGGGNDAGTGGEDGGTGCTGTRPDRMLTLIQVLGQDENAFISTPHKVQLLHLDGTKFDPPVEAMSNTMGKFTAKGQPCGTEAWIHVPGVGPASDNMSTYDSLSLSAPDSGDNLIRISTVGTAATAETTGKFTSDPERIAIGAAVYTVDGTGRRTGSVGCAKVYMDGDMHPAPNTDQRYISGVLPTTWDVLSMTQRSGKFYFGNVVKGNHTFKVTMDDGATFLDLRQPDGSTAKSVTINVPFARKDATSEFKSFLVLFGVDVVGGNPTPASCPED